LLALLAGFMVLLHCCIAGFTASLDRLLGLTVK